MQDIGNHPGAGASLREAPLCEGHEVYIVGAGLSGLAAAHLLIRHAGMAGKRIHILERERLGGGALDGYSFKETGYLMRGEHRLDLHSECLKTLMAELPSEDGEGKSLMDAFSERMARDPNYSLCRVTERHGEEAGDSRRFGLSDASFLELFRLLAASDEDLAGKKVTDVLGGETLASPFFLLFGTTFFFRGAHSALELKRALERRLDVIGSLPDLGLIAYPKYHIYDFLVAPLMEELGRAGVDFRFGVHVTDVAFDCARGKKRATRIDYVSGGEENSIDLREEDLLFITLGSCVENSARGSKTEAAALKPEIREGGSASLWQRIAAQDPAFGRPEVFFGRHEESCCESATVTTSNRKIISAIKKICRRDPFSGKTVTGGFVTVKDSPWLLSWSVGRQPLFKGQAEDVCVISLMGFHAERSGEYVDKPMRDCTGDEICAEWLFHLGLPSDEIDTLAAEETRTVPVLLPYLTAPLLPRSPGDRPAAVVEGAVNFAFMGQFVESADAALTAEYAVRTASDAVFGLLHAGRPLPDALAPASDLRVLIKAASALRDGRSVRELSVKRSERVLIKKVLKLLAGTRIERLMEEAKLL